MTVSYVERSNADTQTLAFYDRAENRFEILRNIFKAVFTITVYTAISKFGDALGVALEDVLAARRRCCKSTIEGRPT